MDKKELQERQIQATTKLCLEFEDESENLQEKIDTLRAMLRIKEIGSRKVLDVLITQIMPLRNNGVSDLSVLAIAEALENELITNLSEMEIIADRLALVMHMDDVRDAYGNISDSMIYDVKKMLEGMKDAREDANKNDRTLQKVEWGDMWDSLSDDIKTTIS